MNVFPALVNYSNGSAAYFDDDMAIGIWVIITLLYIADSILTVLGNSGVLLLIATSPRLGNSIDTLIQNMCFANMIMGIFSIPFHPQSTLSKTWYLPHFLCPFCSYIQVLSSCATVFSLTAIAVIQYRAVMKPNSLEPRKLFIRLIIVGILVSSILVAIPTAVARRVVTLHHSEDDIQVCMNINLTDRWIHLYSIFVSSVQYFIPLTITCTIYLRIGLKLWVTRPPDNPEQTRDEYITRHEIEIINMMALIVILFAMCWFPLQLYKIILHYEDSIRYYKHIRLVWFSFDWLPVLNCCYNPFIYIIYDERYSEELREKFLRLRKRFVDVPPVNDIDMMEL